MNRRYLLITAAVIAASATNAQAQVPPGCDISPAAGNAPANVTQTCLDRIAALPSLTDRVNAWVLVGHNVAESGNHERAIDLFRMADAAYPRVSIIHRAIGTQFLALRRYGPALRELDMAVALDGNDIAATRLRGLVNYMNGNYQASLDDMNRAVNANPVDYGGREIRALTNFQLNNYNTSLQELDELIVFDGVNEVRASFRVLNFVGLERYGDAIAGLNNVRNGVELERARVTKFDITLARLPELAGAQGSQR